MTIKCKYKRFLSVLLIIILITLSFTSCGFKHKAADADAETESQSETETTAETTSETTVPETTSTTEATTATTTTATTTTTTTAAAKPADEEKQGQQKWIRDYSEFKGKKLIAITFDDGPAGDESTGKLLDNLDKYNARVTFFVVGNRVAKYASMLKREYEMGNQIGNHSYSHPNLTKLSESEIKSQIAKTNDEIKKVIGIKPTCMRPPYGSMNASVKSSVGMPLITWSIDTLDWKRKDAQAVSDHIIEKAYDGAVVLLHDLYPTSVEGALSAMETLKDEGYAFVTIDELAKFRGVKMAESKVYYSFKPE